MSDRLQHRPSIIGVVDPLIGRPYPFKADEFGFGFWRRGGTGRNVGREIIEGVGAERVASMAIPKQNPRIFKFGEPLRDYAPAQTTGRGDLGLGSADNAATVRSIGGFQQDGPLAGADESGCLEHNRSVGNTHCTLHAYSGYIDVTVVHSNVQMARSNTLVLLRELTRARLICLATLLKAGKTGRNTPRRLEATPGHILRLLEGRR